MKVSLNNVIKDTNGNDAFDEQNNIVTGRSIAFNALIANFNDEQNLSADEKYRRYKIAMRIKESGEFCDLSIEELSLVKSCIAKGYGIFIVGQMFDYLES